MASAELQSSGFFNLLHSMIRHSDEREELDRSDGVMDWFTDKFVEVDKVVVSKERAILAAIWEHWKKHKTAPSRNMLGDMIAQKEKAEPLKFLLEDYDEAAGDFTLGDAYDMDGKLELRKEDWNRVKLVNICRETIEIATASVPNKNPKLPPKSGNKDAIDYLLSEVQKGVFVGDSSAIGGSFEDTDIVTEIYDKNSWAALHGSLVMPTGLAALGDTIGGLRRAELVGILGYAGQRKSSLGRTIAYRVASTKNYRVLVIPLEETYAETKVAFSLIHAHHEKYGEQTISKRAFDNGILKEDEKQHLYHRVLPDARSVLGDRLIIKQLSRRTWADIKNLIEMESRLHPIDLVYIDYMGLIDVSGERNETAAYNNLFKEAKALALNHNGGEGICIMTPLQGSREGYAKAGENEGAWDCKGIYMYSEAEKSADTVIYVYADENMKSIGQVKVGTCKSRRSGNTVATICKVSIETGLIKNHDNGRVQEYVVQPKMEKKDDI